MDGLVHTFPMPRALGQIDARKHEAILNAASEVLAERGFGASIEEVARRAGVSKQTIYNHYRSKTELVRVIVERRRSAVTAALDEAPLEQPTEVTLAQYATAILDAMLSSESRQLMRMAIISTAEMPELGSTIYDAGIGAASRRLADYLSVRPELEVENPRRAADVFVGMATGRLQTRLLMGVESGFTADEVQARATEAAVRFVRAYRRIPSA